MWNVGIDSGLTGAVAVVDDAGKFVVVHDAPTVEVKKGKGKRHLYVESAMAEILWDILGKGTVQSTGCRLVIENVHAMPKQSVVGMFGMGFGLGLWCGIIAALKIPHERVEPRVWKAAMGLRGDDKGKSIMLASKMFPSAPLTLKKHDGRAEAIILAEWLRRKHERSPLV